MQQRSLRSGSMYPISRTVLQGSVALLALVWGATTHAGVISQLNGGTLHISGDQAANNIQIIAGAANVIVVVDDQDLSTSPAFAANLVEQITVNTFGGSDKVQLLTDFTQGGQLQYEINNQPTGIDINTAAGSDKVFIDGVWGATTIRLGAGDDEVQIPGFGNGTKFGSDLVVRGGKGVDNVVINGINIAGQTTLRGGSGNDVFSIADNKFQNGLDLRTGKGNDNVNFQNNMLSGSGDPTILNGGPGNLDVLSGLFDLAEMSVINFEQIDQIPTDPIQITSTARSIFALSSYNGQIGMGPLIDEEEIEQFDDDQTGFWNGNVSTGVLGGNSTDPIRASGNHDSDVTVNGGSIEIDLFADRYWGQQPGGYAPYGNAVARSDVAITFLVNADIEMQLNGYLSANRASGGYPLAFVSFRIVEVGVNNTNLVNVVVNPQSTISFDDLVESLDGTVVQLESGKTYSIIIDTDASPPASTWNPPNSEAEVSINWSFN